MQYKKSSFAGSR